MQNSQKVTISAYYYVTHNLACTCDIIWHLVHVTFIKCLTHGNRGGGTGPADPAAAEPIFISTEITRTMSF